MKKVLLLLFIIINSTFIAAQDDSLWIKRNVAISAIENDTTLKETVFYKYNGKVVKKFSYKYKNNSLVKFTCTYKNTDTISITETFQCFYLNKNKLIYAFESIVAAYNKTDSSFWSCKYIMNNGKLVNMVSMGHGKSETDDWDAEKEVLKNYKDISQKIKSDIQKRTATVFTASTRTFFPDGKPETIYHNGRYNGIGTGVGTDSIFYPSGNLKQIIFHKNFIDKKKNSGHAVWATLEKEDFFEDGTLEKLSFVKTCYECGECNCGNWVWLNRAGQILSTKNYGNCYNQIPCKN